MNNFPAFSLYGFDHSHAAELIHLLQNPLLAVANIGPG
jgi:hypothetical protein